MVSYLKLAISLALSFVVMYFLTFAMINVLGDLFLNISNLYMALMMLFPMGIIMIVIMWKMFPNKALNIGLVTGFVAYLRSVFHEPRRGLRRRRPVPAFHDPAPLQGNPRLRTVEH